MLGFYIRVLNSQKDGFAVSEALDPLLRAVCADFGIELKHAGDYHAVGRISEQVMWAIERADVVFADANSANENVWYEIGFADRVRTGKVICVSHDSRVLPFDRADVRSIKYADVSTGAAALSTALRRTVRQLVIDDRLRECLAGQSESDLALATERIVRHLSSDKLRSLGTAWLTAIVRDHGDAATARRIALRALSSLQLLSPEIIDAVSDPLVEADVRIELYKLLHGRERVQDAVWDRGLDSEKPRLLEVVAKSAVRHWLDGKLPDSWFRARVGRHADPLIRSAFLSELSRYPAEESSRSGEPLRQASSG